MGLQAKRLSALSVADINDDDGRAGPSSKVNSDAGGWEGETVSLLVNGRQDSYSGGLRQSSSASIYEDVSDVLVAGGTSQASSGPASGGAGRGRGVGAGGAGRGDDKSQQIISKLEELLTLLKEQQQSAGRL